MSQDKTGEQIHMSKKKYEQNIALKFLNKAIDDSIPGFREVIETAQEYIENNGIRNMDYIIDIERAAWEELYRSMPEDRQKDLARIFCYNLMAWRRSKQVIEFSEELEMVLRKQTENIDLTIPMEIFKNLPYKSFFIQIGNKDGGVYVLYENDLLMFQSIKKNMAEYTYGLGLTPNGTIRDCVNAVLENEREKDISMSEKFGSTKKEIMYRYSYVIHLLLYLCAENAKIREDEEQKRIYKPMTREHKIKDRQSEVRVWVCEESEPITIRTAFGKAGYRYSSKSKKGNGTPKRPHVRRAHWRHYYKKDQNGEKVVRLLWIPEVYVHIDQLQNNNVTKISEVQKKDA